MMPFSDDLKSHLHQLETDDRNLADWPAKQLKLLFDSGFGRFGIPEEYGGMLISARESAEFYVNLSTHTLPTAFILSQRQACLGRLVASENTSLKEEFLPQLASGELMTTVGISHLSTSRQHLGRPAVTAEQTEDGYLLNGEIPWVTGGPFADVLLLGATLADQTEILLLVDRQTDGLRVNPPMELLALTNTATGTLTLKDVRIPQSRLVLGPTTGVMKSGSGGTGSFATSALAIGVALRAIEELQIEARSRDYLQPFADQLHAEGDQLHLDLLTASEDPDQTSLTPAGLRSRANSLVLRSTQALLTASKGAGFTQGHLAERLVRQSFFFLVWSCPGPVANAAMQQFACTSEGFE